MDSAVESFLKKKASGDQVPWSFSWRTAQMWESKALTAMEMGAPGLGWLRTDTEARRNLAQQRADSGTGDQGSDLPEPLRVLVQGEIYGKH